MLGRDLSTDKRVNLGGQLELKCRQPCTKSQYQVIVKHVPGFDALFQAMPSESRIISRQNSAAEANAETSHISHQVFGP